MLLRDVEGQTRRVQVFDRPTDINQIFYDLRLLHGVDYNRGSANGWLNAAMTDADIDTMVDAFDRSLDRLRRERALP